MSVVLWGDLARSINDNTKIADYVDAKVLEHNQDPSAHGQTNEAIEVHRVAEVLDHIDEAVTNAKIFHIARAYRAIVDINGNGDYTDIQSAVDYVNSIGGGSILILSGTYTQTSDLTLYSKINLIGEDKDTTIIDFNSGDYNIVFPASGSHIKIQNLTIKNSVDVNGVIYTNGSSDIDILDCEFTGNTTADHSGGGDIYLSATTVNVRIRGNHSDYSGFFVKAYRAARVWIQNNFVEHNYLTFVEIHSTNRVWVTDCVNMNSINNYGAYGIYIHETAPYVAADIFIRDNYFDDVDETCIYITAGEEIRIIGNDFDSTNFGDGIYISGTDYVKIIGNDIHLISDNGIYLTSGADRTIIVGNTIYDNSSYGIRIASSTVNNTLIDGNTMFNNGSGDISDSGTGTIIGDNDYTP